MGGRLPERMVPMADELRLLKVKEFAERAGLSEAGVWKLLRLKKLRGVKIGSSRRIAVAELARLAREGA